MIILLCISRCPISGNILEQMIPWWKSIAQKPWLSSRIGVYKLQEPERNDDDIDEYWSGIILNGVVSDTVKRINEGSIDEGDGDDPRPN